LWVKRSIFLKVALAVRARAGREVLKKVFIILNNHKYLYFLKDHIVAMPPFYRPVNREENLADKNSYLITKLNIILNNFCVNHFLAI
jgi:hypothetical protein